MAHCPGVPGVALMEAVLVVLAAMACSEGVLVALRSEATECLNPAAVQAGWNLRSRRGACL